jgi:CRP-like cAMP-binding protein
MHLARGIGFRYDARHIVGPPVVTPDLRPNPVLAAVRQTPLFRGLSSDDQKRLAAFATLKSYERGDFLWREGDAAEHLTILVKGKVKIVTHGETGDTILELFEEGEPVGAIAVYNYMPYPASAVCLEPVVLLLLPRREYFELLDRNPEFARAIIRELTKLVVAMARRLQELRGQKVDARIAQLFLTLAERLGKEGKGGIEIPIQLTRQEIADLVGTTVESAIRVLSRWGREKIVISGENHFRIPSRDRLREIAEARAD